MISSPLSDKYSIIVESCFVDEMLSGGMGLLLFFSDAAIIFWTYIEDTLYSCNKSVSFCMFLSKERIKELSSAKLQYTLYYMPKIKLAIINPERYPYPFQDNMQPHSRLVTQYNFVAGQNSTADFNDSRLFFWQVVAYDQQYIPLLIRNTPVPRYI